MPLDSWYTTLRMMNGVSRDQSSAIKPFALGEGSVGTHPEPRWVAEIASPSSWRDDRNRKLTQYERAQIPEYWIIDLLGASPRVEVYQLQDGKYQITLYGPTDKIALLSGSIEIDLVEVLAGLP